MIVTAVTHNDRPHVVARTAINHPHADEVSVVMGSGAYADFPHSVELAFFKGGKWVTYEMDELAKYCDKTPDFPVYARVPLLDFAKFLQSWTENDDE